MNAVYTRKEFLNCEGDVTQEIIKTFVERREYLSTQAAQPDVATACEVRGTFTCIPSKQINLVN